MLLYYLNLNDKYVQLKHESVEDNLILPKHTFSIESSLSIHI